MNTATYQPPLREIIDPDERQREAARRWLEYERRKEQAYYEATGADDYERRLQAIMEELGI